MECFFIGVYFFKDDDVDHLNCVFSFLIIFLIITRMFNHLISSSPRNKKDFCFFRDASIIPGVVGIKCTVDIESKNDDTCTVEYDGFTDGS